MQCMRSICTLYSNKDTRISAIGSSYCQLLLPEYLEITIFIGSRIKTGDADLTLLEESLKMLTVLVQSLADSKKSIF